MVYSHRLVVVPQVTASKTNRLLQRPTSACLPKREVAGSTTTAKKAGGTEVVLGRRNNINTAGTLSAIEGGSRRARYQETTKFNA